MNEVSPAVEEAPSEDRGSPVPVPVTPQDETLEDPDNQQDETIEGLDNRQDETLEVRDNAGNVENSSRPVSREHVADADAAGVEKVVKRNTTNMMKRSSLSILEKRRTSTIESLSVKDDAEQKRREDEARWKLPVDFEYDPHSPDLQQPLGANELPRQIAVTERNLGFDFGRYYNLVWTSHTEVAYIIGHVVRFINVETGALRSFLGRDSGGVGCVAADKNFNYLAVAENSLEGPPNIYIYRSEGMKLYRILRRH